jgi:hypothetical protein
MDAKTFQPYWSDFRRDFMPFARRRTGSMDAAEDAMQETYLQIYPRLERFERRDMTDAGYRKMLFAWMQRVLWSVCTELRRRDSRYLSVPEVMQDAADNTVDVLDYIETQETKLFLLDLMDRASLSKMQRRCLLAKLADYKYAEIAGPLNTTPRYMSWHTYQALRKVRAVVAADFSGALPESSSDDDVSDRCR